MAGYANPWSPNKRPASASQPPPPGEGPYPPLYWAPSAPAPTDAPGALDGGGSGVVTSPPPSAPPADPPAPVDPEWTEDYFLNQDPDAAFMKYLQSQGGYNPATAQTRWAQSQQGNVYNTYKAQAASNPDQGFWDYLQANKPDLATQFNNQSPEQRGDYSSRILTPRARWVAG